MMTLRARALEKLEQVFSDANIDLTDSRGDGYHLQLIIKAKQLNGLSSVAQHRAIYQALGSELTQEIHALSIKVLPS